MKIPVKYGYIEVNDSKADDKAINLTVFERGEFSSQRADIQITRNEAIDLMAAIAASLLHEEEEK